MLILIAWRNIWRNKLRSFVVITAVGLGLVGGVFSLGMMYGMVNQRVQSIIENEISHIQVHNPLFTENYEMKYVVDNGPQIIEYLNDQPEVMAICSRLKIAGMASTSATGTGVMIMGVDASQEMKVTSIHRKLKQGKYLKGKRNPIVIGEKLAGKLKARLRSKIVLTMQSRQGVITYGAFRVVGIFKTSNTAFDQGQVFVRKSDLARLTGFKKDEVHELAIVLNSIDNATNLSKRMRNKFGTYLVQTWRQIQPDLAMVTDFMEETSMVFISIILAALGFGIVNTMLMVVLERIRELGMLMAIGMTKRRVFWMIILESVFLSLVGGVSGLLISKGLINYFGHTGIDLGLFADGFESVGYSAVVYPQLDMKYYFLIGFMVVAMGIVGAIYPALKALKYNPANAMRIE